MMKKDVTEAERTVPLLFDPESLGRSLREVAIDVIETEGSAILSRWFHSTSDVDLLIWSDEDKNVIKHQVNFFGQVVEWNIFEGVKTGFIIEEELGSNGDECESSEVIQFDQVPEAKAIRQALLLLEHVPDLNESDKDRIRDNLLNRVVGVADSNDEFLRLYGDAYESESNRKRRSGFWRRLRRWFSGPS